MFKLKKINSLVNFGVILSLGFGTSIMLPKPSFSASLTNDKNMSLVFVENDIQKNGLDLSLENLGIKDDILKDIVENILVNIWKIILPDGRPLSPEDFTTIKSARLLVACVDGKCEKDQSQSNSLVSIQERTVQKNGVNGSKALISGALSQTIIGKNPACVGDVFVDGLNPIKCKKDVDAVGKPGDIFVREVTASAFGLVYDGRGGRLLIDGASDTDKIYRDVPEPATILGSATALGLGALLKREHSKRQKKG